VADLHENYPEAARQWRKGMDRPRKVVQQVFTPVSRLRRLERDCVGRVDRTLAVTDEGRDHYIDDCGADPESVRVVSNTVDLPTFEEATPVEGYQDDYVVVYVGSFGPHRGLETAIKAFPEVIAEVPNARLLLVGSAGEDAYGQRLRDLVAEVGIADHVEFTGWVDFDDVPAYIAASDVCFVLHNDNPHTATTVPHKLFQYMALRRPVVVTDVGPLGRIVREYDAGRVVGDGDTVATAGAFVELHDAPTRDRLGANARRAVEERYNWEHDAERLRSVYDEIQTSSNG
jgi:glycosyltransferase involved in cell wall biosynthesis